MNARYFTRATKPARANDDYWADDIPRSSTMDVCDHEPTDTGLFDVHGHSIWRGPNPMGFLWENE